MGEREFDPGLDTPRANQPGAGQPVPGSPVWKDAQLRARVNEEQRKVEETAAGQQNLESSSTESESKRVESAAAEKSAKPTTRRAQR